VLRALAWVLVAAMKYSCQLMEISFCRGGIVLELGQYLAPILIARDFTLTYGFEQFVFKLATCLLLVLVFGPFSTISAAMRNLCPDS
jgi:hypothetical protein